MTTKASTTSQSAYKDADAAYRAAVEKQKTERQKAIQNEKDKKEKQSLTKEINTLKNKTIPGIKKSISDTDKLIAPIQAELVTYINAHKNEPGFPSYDDNIYINYRKNNIAGLESRKTGFKNELKQFQAILDQKQKRLDQLTKKSTTSSNRNNTTTGNAPRGQKIKFSTDYKYNAPMVSEAYFGGNSFIDTILEGKFVDQGKYGDAREAWKGTTGGRGTIQMDEKFLSTFTTSTTLPDKIKLDTQKYGFKFLYNPQTVGMSWGLMNYMSPPYEAMAQDPFQVVSAGLMTSTVTFDLVLNRIKDFDYLDKNGFVSEQMKKFSGSNISADLDPAQRNRIYSANYLANNPYPETVPIDDQKEIYEKGTMYDLEYLFKTINGPDGSFVSKMNGTTADKGWMRPTIVELHLGNKLRYRVRITEFAVNHVIFNPRMVPIFSTVRMTCNRFADGPETDYYGSGQLTTANGNPTWSSSPGPGDLRAAGLR